MWQSCWKRCLQERSLAVAEEDPATPARLDGVPQRSRVTFVTFATNSEQF